ncbi:MAG: TRAP transporter substrate-binding protein [Hyphomicrobium sp.]|jgi:C4-dicarboxylate-binding protein DctP
MKTPVIIAVIALSVLLGCGGASAGEPITLRFSHVVAPDTPKGMGAEKFKELAERYTDGRVKVEVYPLSQLYRDSEELEALQLGAVEMVAPSLAKFGPLGAREFEVFDLPYLFPDRAALRAVTQGPIGKDLLKGLESKGIRGLAFWDNGFKIMSANKPIRMPEDLVGLRMRIQPSRVLQAQMEALGVVPQVIPLPEVYQALQMGVLDGTENPPSNMLVQKIFEVQAYATLSNHGYLGYAVIVNKSFWDGLPSDVRASLNKAMREATDYTNNIAESVNAQALAAMKATGKTQFHEQTLAEKRAWIAALAPVYSDVASRIGKDRIDAIRAATGVTQ